MSISENITPPSATTRPGQPVPRGGSVSSSLGLGLRLVLVRLRFVVVLVGILLLVGFWPALRNYWDKYTRGAVTPDTSISSDTEYWCPMCPGVLSAWPGKCPVCNMSLVRHKKQEQVPLPNGVLARMQLSPYRIQLAGIRTYPVEYRRLEQEVVMAGLTEPAGASLQLHAEVFEKDMGLVRLGRAVAATSEAYPDQTFPGQVARLADRLTPGTGSLRVWLALEDPRHELRPGMFLTARLRVPAAELDASLRAWIEEWRNRALVDLLAHGVFAPGLPTGSGAEPLLRMATRRALLVQGLVPAVPESAVVDTGARKVTYVERMPGMFDAVEVTLGRRCGEFYPLLRGLEPGEQVVSAGAFLLDAATRLDPSVAASYFGATRSTAAPPVSSTLAPDQPSSDRLSAQDQILADKQKVCPVTGEPLDSMGGPVKVVVAGKTVFVCCKGCMPKVKKNPEKYLKPQQ